MSDPERGGDADLLSTMDGPDGPRRWLKVLDQTKCIGCHACTTACKSENDVPLSVTRTFVKSVDVGRFPEARRAFQVTRCNQCADAPCVAACPTAAMHTRPDGIVDFDKDLCIGCKACMAACPYDAIFINPDDHAAEKCNMCTHRLDIGLEPACVTVCPTQAIIVGDAEDPESEAARIVARHPVSVRRPEKGTRPQVFYRGATQSTLDPLGADRPAGDTYAWSEIPRQPGEYASGHPGASNSSAAALLSYDVAHGVPWDWRVALYTWTKSIAAGAYLTALLLALLGRLSWTGVVFGWVVPVLAAVALAATVVILIWDLEHPERFYYVLTKPQWRSWLVRGGVIITLYAAVLAVHLLGSLLGSAGLRQAVAVAGGPVAVATAVYTAYLFAQATARDMWQNPLLPPHLLVQAMVAGAAALLPIAAWWTGGPVVALAWVLAVAAAVHVLLVFGEITLAHPSAHARLAMHEMLTGGWRAYFWAGLPLVAVGVAAPLAGAWVAIPALLGLLAHEHAYVQAGQSVPLA